ncbi:MAG: P-loop NTPase [Halodesulfurarchaeum sp.]
MTDGNVYAVASGKGGVGKTTTAVNIGAAVAEADGSVVVVDVDLGMANVGDVLAVSATEATLHDVLAGDAPLEAAIESAPGDVDVVLGSEDIEDFGRADPAKLREIIETLRETYDVVILDGGGGLSHDMTVPLGLADGVVLVVTPTEASMTNAAKTRELIERLGGRIEGLVVNRIGGAGRTTPEAVGDRLGERVLGAVPEDGAVAVSTDEGTPLVTIDRQSPAAQSFREIGYGLIDEPLPRDWGEEGDSEGAVSEIDDGPAESGTDEEPTESERSWLSKVTGGWLG